MRSVLAVAAEHGWPAPVDLVAPLAEEMPNLAVEALMAFALMRGIRPIRDAIGALPDPRVLWPLWVALSWRLGESPRCPVEVTAVAKDVGCHLDRMMECAEARAFVMAYEALRGTAA